MHLASIITYILAYEIIYARARALAKIINCEKLFHFSQSRATTSAIA